MRTSEIGDIVRAVSKWDPRKQGSGDFTYVDLSSIDRQVKKVTRPTSIEVSEAPSRARQIIAAGDVLVSTVRPNLNAVACVPIELDGATASTGFCVLRPSDDELDSRYLFHWVQSDRFVGEMVRCATGASYPAVSDNIVKGSTIPLPPIEEQRRIATILDAADVLRTKRREAIAKLDMLLQAVFADMFGDPHANPAGWPMAALADVVAEGTTVTYGIVQAGPEFSGGVPYVRTGDLVRGKIALDNLRHTDPAIAKRFPRSRIETDEIVMSIRATVGTTALVPPVLDGANLTQGTARIAPGPRTKAEFLLYHLRSQGSQHWLERQVKGATFREITLGRLRELPVLVPPIELQRIFMVRSHASADLRIALQRSMSRVDSIFSSLQQRAFRGAL